ncbi:glycoside hydrolase family 16 protein [Aeoliella mucimassa]|uniref:Glucan endo-1,3-beta-glucosidase A1 n=1 Tax=Aeoliella mucimassa TaxID=2527972 RepID=A0A518AWP4_9BACT|nr:glycoside hydrolase family 16 protein [Aeoliella mucimassa]QDU59143.1 Glucan endo-1,3-beta-glucosidase A1 precursor [Aeoliella mucimassa]
MNRFADTALACSLLLSLIWTLGHSPTATAADTADQWKLTWSDEFDGQEVDRKKWDFDIGNGFYNYSANQWIAGWGNSELEYYTDSTTNAKVEDGQLHLRAVKQSLHGCGYTSARMKTRAVDGSPLFNQRYGRFEFRAKLPTGQGVWPALWMLPQEETYGGWAASGEIDVMEARGQQPGKVLGTLHYGGAWPANVHSGGEYEFPAGQDISGFHVYALEWEPGEMRWYVDDHLYATQNFWWSSSKTNEGGGLQPANEGELNPWPAPFGKPYYLVMNVAVGGQFVGNPDASTKFPAEMVVDYVRVYEKKEGFGETKPRGEGKLPFAR